MSVQTLMTRRSQLGGLQAKVAPNHRFWIRFPCPQQGGKHYKVGDDTHPGSVFRAITAMGSLNNSCLILASQNPSSARERKIRQGGNHNRDWGRHIRLAQSKSSGYKTLLTSPVVTGITCSKYDILTAHSLKGWASCLMDIRRQFNIISSNRWYTLHLADQIWSIH